MIVEQRLTRGPLKTHPDASFSGRSNGGLDESHAGNAVLDGRIGHRGVRFAAGASRTDGVGDLRVDVGEALEVAFRMPGRHARDAARRLPRGSRAPRDDARRLAEGRVEE